MTERTPLPHDGMACLEAVLTYIRHGWPVVPVCIATGPLRDDGTGPCNAYWHMKKLGVCASPGKTPKRKWKGRTATTEAEAQEWWRKGYQSNIALLMGYGHDGPVVALDVDGSEGVNSLAALEREHGALPKTAEQQTGRGRHLIYKLPSGIEIETIKNDAGEVAPGLDVRARGGYIIAAPSVHPAGAVYRWKDPHALITEVPAWLLALLPRRGPPSNQRKVQPGRASVQVVLGNDSGVSRKEASRYKGALDKALAEDLAALASMSPNSGRNVFLNKTAYWSMRLAIGAGVDLDYVRDQCHFAAEQSGLTQGEITSTLNSAQRAAVRDGMPDLPDRGGTESKPRKSSLSADNRAPFVKRDAGGQHDSTATAGPTEEGLLPVVEVSPATAAVAREALQHLAKHPGVYQRVNSGLVRVVRAPELPEDLPERERERRPPPHAAVIEPLPLPTLAGWLTEMMRFYQYDKREKCWRWTTPPDRVVSFIHAERDLNPVRPLTGVVEAPTLRPDGSILAVPGYDARTGLLLEWVGNPIEVAGHPSRDDARSAYLRLADVFGEFNYQADRNVMIAASIAAVMTPLARAAIRGPVPLFLWEADRANAGKTLAATCAGIIVTGRAPSVRQFTDDDDEMNKRFGAIGIHGIPVVFFDNIRKHIEGSILEAALTAYDTLAIRGLGALVDREFPWRTTIYATGNGVSYSHDMSGRVVHIMMFGRGRNTAGAEPGTVERTYRHPDLQGYVTQKRGDLLKDALTILRAHVVAGRPRAATTLDTFESWSRTVADPIAWASGYDPVKARPPEHTDRDTNSARRVALAWANSFSGETITLREVIARCLTADPSKPGARGLVHAEAVADLREALSDMAGTDLSRMTDRHKTSVAVRLKRDVVGRTFPVAGGGTVTVRSRGKNRQDVALYEAQTEASKVATCELAGAGEDSHAHTRDAHARDAHAWDALVEEQAGSDRASPQGGSESPQSSARDSATLANQGQGVQGVAGGLSPSAGEEWHGSSAESSHAGAREVFDA